MKPVIDRWALVVVGFWNPMIFNPKWLKTNITDSNKIEISYPVLNPHLPLKIGFEEIFLLVSNSSLQITPKNAENATILKQEEIGQKIFDKLCHTPVSAIGLNFVFSDDCLLKQLKESFVFHDTSIFAEKGFVVENTAIARKMIVDNCIVNFQIEMQKDDVRFNFNFHSDIKNVAGAKLFLQKGILMYKSMAEEILKDIYSIEAKQ